MSSRMAAARRRAVSTSGRCAGAVRHDRTYPSAAQMSVADVPRYAGHIRYTRYRTNLGGRIR